MLIDSHCHLQKLDLSKKKLNLYLQFFRQNKIFYKILLVSLNIHEYKYNLEIMNDNNDIIDISIGIHPYYASTLSNNNLLEKLRNIIKEKKIVALGETGLDFTKKKLNNFEEQKKSFIIHIMCSIEYNIPIIIHARDCINNICYFIKKYGNNKLRGVIHSFSGNIYDAKKILDLGLFISLSGIVTFKNAYDLREALKYIPIKRLLVETDSPYLSPEPLRGKKNFPSRIPFIIKKISDIKKISYKKIKDIMRSNYDNLILKK